MEEPKPPAPLTELEMLLIELAALVDRIVIEIRLESPKAKPVWIGSEIVANICDALERHMGEAGVKQVMLYAFENTHEAPMSFIDIHKAKEALQQIAAMRRRVLASQAGVIIPGKDTK